MNWLRLIEFCQEDDFFSDSLEAARSLELPNWVISGGSIRDLTWSRLVGEHKAPKDIDLIFLDNDNISKGRDIDLEHHLNDILPRVWNVRNAARLSRRNGITKYAGIYEAMSFSPSTVSSVGISQLIDDRISAFSIYGFQDLFDMKIVPSPRYLEMHTREDFQEYVHDKGWLEKWPTASLCIESRS